jgi:hypothetical protein
MSLRPSNKQKNAAPVSAPQTRLEMVLRAGLRVPTSCGYTEKIIDLNDWEFSTNATIMTHFGMRENNIALWNTKSGEMYNSDNRGSDVGNKRSVLQNEQRNELGMEDMIVKKLLDATQAELDMLTTTLPNACSSLLGAIASRKKALPSPAKRGRTKQTAYPGGGSKKHTLPNGQTIDRMHMSPDERQAIDEYESNAHRAFQDT